LAIQGIWLPLHGYSLVSTPLWAGIYMLPLSAGFLTAAAFTFRLLTLLPANFSYTWFARPLLANGLAMGLFAAPNTAGTMTAVPADQRGVASGIRSTF
jgi:hypothetical protein